MVRTQLQIDENTYEALRETAHKQKRSMSAIVREILRERLVKGEEPLEPITRKYSFIGSGSSKEHDISVRHDDYLAEDFA
jgi:plasmid stability protein